MPIRREHAVRNAEPVVGFDTEGWTRFLTIEGERAYKIGGSCDTCTFFFERIKSERLSPSDVADRLQNAPSLFDPDLIATVDALVPAGQYGLADVMIRPRLVGPCDEADYFSHESVDLFGMPSYTGVPVNPQIQYWRAGDAMLEPTVAALAPRRLEPNWLFHFVVPMEPPHWLDRDRIDLFKAQLSQGGAPAALGLAVLDVRAPAVIPGDRGTDPNYVYGRHWCLATYLLDGHHKMQAAAEAHAPVRMLVYLARDASMATPNELDTVLDVLAQPIDT